MKPFAWTPADGSPTIASPSSMREPSTTQVALDDPDARAREVELVLAVDPRKLRRLAADERAAGGAADLGEALDELRDLLEVDPVRGDVVEEEERLGAARQDVVDAVRAEVRAAAAERAALPREDQLRPDRVGRRCEEPRAVERMEAGERAEPSWRRSTPRRRAGARRRRSPSRSRLRRPRTSGSLGSPRRESTREVGRQPRSLVGSGFSLIPV